jgi:hypothetical protein
MRLIVYLGSFVLTTAVGVAAIAGADTKSNSSPSPATPSRRVDARTQSFVDDVGLSVPRGAMPKQNPKNC